MRFFFLSVKNGFLAGILIIFCLFLLLDDGFATPLYNPQDSAIIHTVMGADKFYSPEKKSILQLHLSPYFQHTASSSSGEESKFGRKTSIGNMLGRWNMLGAFLGTGGKPRSGKFSKWSDAKSAIESLDGFSDLENNYDPVKKQKYSYSNVSVKYEKMGFRSQLSFDFGFGLGFVVKGGVGDYKQIPRFEYATDFKTEAGLPVESDGEETSAAGSNPGKTIYEKLLSKNARNEIAKELELSLYEARATDFEDLHIEVYWNVPINFKEKGSDACTLIPHLSVGAWLPLGREKDYNKAFSVATGNDGFAGLTLEGSLNMDFPGMLQIGFGGGGAFFTTREIKNYRVPTSEYQVGIYPWKTTVSKHPGPVWYVNMSMKAENIMSKKNIPNFSFYFDYVFTDHQQDSIQVREPIVSRKKSFKPEKLERESHWKSQYVNAGLTYGLTSNFYLGLAVQGYIAGVRTYRTTTTIGSVIFKF
jgi:hypothetical protein